MSASLASFGLRPIFHPSGLGRAHAIANGISSGFATDLFQGTPVAMGTSGVLALATLTAAFIGSFDGVEYTDANGRRQYAKRWIANTVATEIVAYVYDDPLIVYEIQASGSVAQTAIGDQADFSGTAGVLIASGNTTTQLSTTAMSSSLEGAGVQGQLRILDLSPYPDNIWGDAFTIVRVQIAQHQYVAPATAI